jgi:beta-galactosidase beta subunit
VDFLTGNPPILHQVILSGDIAAVYFAEDVHKPKIAVDGKPARAKKLVIKIAL